MAEVSVAEAMELAMRHHRAGRLAEAEVIYRQVLSLQPRQPEALHLLGVIALQMGRQEMGMELIQQALAIDPSYAAAHNSLGYALSDKGQMVEAIEAYQRALALNPKMDETHNNMGIALKDAGRLEEAIEAHRRALAINPANVVAHSNLVYTLYFHAGYDARAIYAEHVLWNQRHAMPLGGLMKPHGNERSAGRRLRVGYVSPNLRGHVVGRFMMPLLAKHDRKAVEIFCYSTALVKDDFSARLGRHAEVWRDAASLSEEQLAAVIRADEIDILVDLTMHMQNNRLLTFARKPAPVQVTYLAYCGTTGMEAMDYRLSDPWLDPVGMDETVYSEKTVRLPETYWCYQASDEAPVMNELPALSSGCITFGCLNNFCKVSDETLEAWGELMRLAAGSRLILHCTAGKHRERVAEILGRYGVTADRIEFVPHVELAAYFSLYQRIDVALDPFPYAGGTTTCDALWMGVPVVTLAGETAVGRGGVSILSNVGCAELIAGTRAEYVRIAAELAADWPRLQKYRAALRGKMSGSVLMDAPRFAREIEAAYRKMWQHWCGSAASGA